MMHNQRITFIHSVQIKPHIEFCGAVTGVTEGEFDQNYGACYDLEFC